MKHASDTTDTYQPTNYYHVFKFLFVTVFFSHISTQPLRKVCIANRNIGQVFKKSNFVLYSVLFHFGHICRWAAVGISVPSIFCILTKTLIDANECL